MNPLVDLDLSSKYLPDSPVIIGKKIIIFSQFIDKILERTAIFLEHGITSGNHVAIMGANNEDFIINIIALWKLNVIPVLLNTRLLSSELNEQISFSECKFVIADKPITVIENCTLIYEFIEPRKNIAPVLPSPEIEKPAVILFTSGSAGRPKAVEISFNNLIASAKGTESFVNFKNNDRWLASLPFFHIGGFSIISRALLYGNPLIIPESLSSDDICSAMLKHKPALCSLVSTQLKRLIDQGCTPNEELRAIFLGGGFIEDELLTSAISKGWRIVKVYGSSETSSMVTALDCSSGYKLGSAGKPLPGSEIKVVNEEGMPVMHNVAGEILVYGDTVVNGYLNNAEENNLKFNKGFYYSGDIGYLDEEGYLYIQARRTDLIISGGENINPYDVERAILLHPSVSEAAVFPVNDETWGQVSAAAIKLNTTIKLELDELKSFLGDKIAAYKIPRHLVIVDELPKSPLGKIQREKLPELLKF